MRKLLKNIEYNLFEVNIKNISLFAVIWFMLGFSLGTATLMGPVRWITDYTRSSNMDPSVENWAIRIVIILFVIISFIIAINLTKNFVNSNSVVNKTLTILIPFLLTAFSLWLWLNPKMMQFNSVQTSQTYENIEFIFGPYPEEDKFLELKKLKVTGIISLLHESVVPFEPKLLSDERELAKKYGIEVIHLPMLPWISSNENSLNEIKKLAVEGKGKYYVHCYLGKDRVGVVRKAIQQILGEEKISGEIRKRNIDDKKQFERGIIIKLDEGIYFSPYPTDEEFFSYLLSGSFENVISLLTPENPEDVPWIEKEEKVFSENGINFKLLPINLNSYNPEKLLKYIEIVRKLEKPVLVHAFLTPSPQSEMFTYSFNTGNPSLPKYLFETMMRNGKVKFHNLSIAYGPKPLPNEIGGYLYKKGIRKIGFSGNETNEISLLKKIAKENKIEWVKISPNNIKIVNNGGPWYLFGSEISELLKNSY